MDLAEINVGKKGTKLLFIIAIIQILLLINFSPSSFLIQVFSIDQVGVVSAEVTGCCLSTTDGAICQNVIDNLDSNCESSLPTACENVPECELGCCYNDVDGLCSTNSPLGKCNLDGGIWENNAACNTADCQKGCCIRGQTIEWVTKQRCNYLSSLEGIFGTFDRSLSEASCLLLEDVQKLGACELDVGICVFGTEAECVQQKGSFNENLLCSHESLDNECEKQSDTDCVEGKDEVYWFDSCGNRENIYSSNKIESWNNGDVLNKEDSCNSDSGNVGSDSCGNCDYQKSSMCGSGKTKDGDEMCIDLACKNAPYVVDAFGKVLEEQDRENGESWCVYDGTVGDSRDIVGSRHFRYYCMDGEVEVEPCSDFRQGVCGKVEIENEPVDESDVVEVSESVGCVANRWRECVELTSEFYSLDGQDFKAQKTFFKELNKDSEIVQQFKTDCEDIGQCTYNEMELDKTPLIPVCMPRFPGGLDFYSEEVVNDTREFKSQETCDIATSIPYIGTCVKVEKSGDCSGCISGCECGTERWLEEANRICASMGDCGAYVNIARKVTEGGYTATKGKTKEKEEAIEGLNQNYLDFLKNYTEITRGEVKINYKNITDIPFIITDLGKISTSAKDEHFLSFIGDFFDWFFELFGLSLLDDCGIKKTYYHYTCLPFQAPTGGSDCDKCNEDLLKPCTEYRCKSLGAACELANKDSSQPRCFEDDPDDSTPPSVSMGEIDENHQYELLSDGVELKASDGGCITEGRYVNFLLMTNELAQCKVDYNVTDSYENMTSYFGGDNLYLEEHLNDFEVPNLDSDFVYGINGDAQELRGKLNMYVRCQDTHGNVKDEAYIVKMCIKSGPDFDATQILFTIPENNGYLSYGTTDVDAAFFLDEPAECKWDIESNRSYDAMANTMNCSLDLVQPTDEGWICEESFNGLDSGENKFYIKCKDQPWLPANNETRNIHKEDYVYTLYGSPNPLVIDEVSPNGEFDFGFEPISLELGAETSGGAQNGKAICRYYFDEQGWEGLFSRTNDNLHSTTFNSMMRGDYALKVSCKDAGQNEVNGTSTFRLNIDSTPPKVIRSYHEGNQLKIVTNEDAECAYGFNRCSFNIANGTDMTSGFATDHFAEWQGGRTYYVKCADVWGNSERGCGFIVSPGLVVH